MTPERRLEHAAVIVDALIGRADAPALVALEVSTAPTAVYVYPDAKPRSTNAAWRAMFAAGPPEAVTHAIARVATSGAPVHLPEVAIAEAEGVACCAATVSPRRDRTGAVVAEIVVCEDVTDDMVARSLGIDPGVLAWSARAGAPPDYYNRRWHAYAGDARDEQAIAPDDLPRYQIALADALRTRASSEVEVRVHGRDRRARWHRVAFAVHGGRWYASAVDIHDVHGVDAERNDLIARLQAARSDALQANRLKDQFLATVSHELRGPLTTMQLWEKVLRDDATEPEVRLRALDAIHQSVVTQTRLVGDLLDVARAVSGKLYVDLRPIELEPILAAALAAIAPSAAARHVALQRWGTPTRGRVDGDEARLLQVFENLLSNAVKFSSPGGRVAVSTRVEGRSIAVEVVDAGRGISPEFLPRLFEPFSQVDDALTRHEGGLGLGLAISRQLVELHRGTLVAHSAGLGCGATFTATLPLSNTRALSPRPGIAGVRALEHVAVLVVDDDSRVLEALALLLDRTGAVVDTADSADEARARIASKLPEVIICDIAMPGENGYRFIEKLRAAHNEVPAIAVTAHASEADAKRAVAAGFDLHLAKPIDFERLVGAIADMVAGRRDA